jgi:hypothetical protein
LLWLVKQGEEPWGVQILDGGGRLVSTTSLVGVPAPRALA